MKCTHYACRCARAAELAAMELTAEAIAVHSQEVECREKPEPDVMQQRWACLSCGQTFRFGELKLRGGVGEPIAGNDHGLNCPNCRGMKIHPADGATVELDAYHGEKGTLQ